MQQLAATDHVSEALFSPQLGVCMLAQVERPDLAKAAALCRSWRYMSVHQPSLTQL
jgi:hypothetical protein